MTSVFDFDYEFYGNTSDNIFRVSTIRDLISILFREIDTVEDKFDVVMPILIQNMVDPGFMEAEGLLYLTVAAKLMNFHVIKRLDGKIIEVTSISPAENSIVTRTEEDAEEFFNTDPIFK